MADLRIAELNREIVYLTIQYLHESGYKEAARMLEQETGYYFHMEHFEQLVLSGQWKVAEKYLGGFTKATDNRQSRKIYFEMRKQHFIETLDRGDRVTAVDILTRDLKVFAAYNEELFKELTQLLTLSNIRENKALSGYKDAQTGRAITMAKLKKAIRANPIFHGKLRFPPTCHQRLKVLINQGLNWQHHLCLFPHPNPQIDTLFRDHLCGLPGVLVTRQLLLPSPPPAATATHHVAAAAAPREVISVPSGSGDGEEAEDGGDADNDEVTSAGPMNVDRVNEEKLPLLYEPTDLPTIVIKTFDMDSVPTSMEFHPRFQSFLLVGTRAGKVSICEVRSGDRIFSTNFNVWDMSSCTLAFKISMANDPQVSVTRVTWSPDGSRFGAAFSKHMVQVYSFPSETEVKRHLEIDAHAGAVTDIAFCKPVEHLLLITGGDDKIIKVWDAVTGERMFSFEGHNAAICSVCPHSKDGFYFIFSTSSDGIIKVWLYDEVGARLDYPAPGLGYTILAYNDLTRRLFSSGTNPQGQSFLVEWDETEGLVKRMYKGLAGNYMEVLQLTIGNNKYLAVGDDHTIKFWHMDHDDPLMSVNAGGGLPARPKVRFNKEGSLLAVIAAGCTIKILGSGVGTDLVSERQEAARSISSYEIISKTLKKRAEMRGNLTIAGPEGAGAVKDSPMKDCDSRNHEKMELGRLVAENDENLKFYHAYEQTHCVSLQLASDLNNAKISRLVYTNSGKGVLALASNANHLLWTWKPSALNLSGMATAKDPPRLWKARGGQLMINHHNETPTIRVIPCFALSKNDCYLVSASGGAVSLFNTFAFKTLTTIVPARPSATCIAMYPRDNNIIAIGMDDSTIVIYNVRFCEVITKLRGHHKRVTGLAFSETLDVLISSGGDLQIILWEVEGWTMTKSDLIQPLNQSLPPSWVDTTVQFDKDQRRFLAANSTRLAIYNANDLSLQAMWPHDAVFPGPVFSSFGDFNTVITNAVFSCNGRMVYAGFSSGSVGVFDTKTLDLAYQIFEDSYIPKPIGSNMFPTAVAAHPNIPGQFAVGLSDGRVFVVEPNPGDETMWTQLALDEKKPDEGSPSKNQDPNSEHCDSSSSV